ncbi:MAG: ANTAR domain-containing protein [Rhodospirillaceae bacterium]|nr:ANTAR domain-containing protein [Rhodospirillaceae bacterium]
MAGLVRGRSPGAETSEALRNIRSLRVLVIHPHDEDGEELLRHLKRIGCQTQATWPPPKQLPPNVDVVFLSLRQVIEAQQSFPWKADNPPAALVVIVDYENPVMVDAVLKLTAQAVIGLPIRPFGLLTNLVSAHALFTRERKLQRRIEKLEEKVKSIKRLNQAKEILMKNHGLDEDEAYRMIRSQAMNKRMTTEAIAIAIINASEILGLKQD